MEGNLLTAPRTLRCLGCTLLATLLVFIGSSSVGSSDSVDPSNLSPGNLGAGNQLICGPTDGFSWDDLDEDILWLARAVYSETKRPEEQELVAWVIRNRVESEYRGRSDYRAVVLDPFQFSAFNQGYPKRSHYMSLDTSHRNPGWYETLRIAYRVARADTGKRPFSIGTRHFYSEISRISGFPPGWAQGRTPIQIRDRDIDPRRFRFFADVI